MRSAAAREEAEVAAPNRNAVRDHSPGSRSAPRGAMPAGVPQPWKGCIRFPPGCRDVGAGLAAWACTQARGLPEATTGRSTDPCHPPSGSSAAGYETLSGFVAGWLVS